MSQNKPYRILKLKNGEELITSIIGQDGNELIVERPMMFIYTPMQDHNGFMKQVTMLQNWLINSNQVTTKIPKNEVMTFLDPSDQSIKLYNIEKESEDMEYPISEPFNMMDFINNTLHTDTNNSFPMDRMDPMDPMDPMENIPSENIKNLLDDLMGLNDAIESIPTEPDEEEQNYISMTLFFPPKSLLVLAEAGLLDVEDVRDMIDSLTIKKNNKAQKKRKKSPKSDPDHPKFGNRWFDWSEDLGDYFGQ